MKKELAGKMTVRPIISASAPQNERRNVVEASQVRERKPLIPIFEMLSLKST